MSLYNNAQVILEPVPQKHKIYISGQIFAHRIDSLKK